MAYLSKIYSPGHFPALLLKYYGRQPHLSTPLVIGSLVKCLSGRADWFVLDFSSPHSHRPLLLDSYYGGPCILEEGETLVWHELRHQETELWAHHHTVPQIITYCKNIAKSLQIIIRGEEPRGFILSQSHTWHYGEREEKISFWLMTPSRGQGLSSLISICRSLKPSPTTSLS